MSKKKTGPVDFLTAAKTAIGREPIELPALGVTVYAKALSAAEVRRISESCVKPGKKAADGDFDNEKLALLLVAASIVNEDGDRLIPDGREAEMADMPNAMFSALQAAALRVNGMGGAVAGN